MGEDLNYLAEAERSHIEMLKFTGVLIPKKTLEEQPKSIPTEVGQPPPLTPKLFDTMFGAR